MQQVIFRLLGPPEIRYKDQLIKIPRRRSRALLYYLVCAQTPQPRERLLALLCGEVDEESARHTFKTLLAEVRALLRGFDSTIEWIISDGDLLKLNPRAPLWLDTEIFEKVTAVTSRNLNQAVGLYRGDFLDGFFLKDSPGFDAWVRSARDHFQHLYLMTLRRLAELYESENKLEEAITCTQILLTTDPLLEEAYARLMHLYWLTGNRIEALRQYERLCIILAQELAIRPSASTQSLYEQIARSSQWSLISKPAVPAPLLPAKQEQSVPPFAGRTIEMAWLQSHLTGSANHHPLLLLQGEAGIGKTRLIQETLRQVCSSWLILQGTCQEVERAHPYHAIVEALRRGLAKEDLTQLNLPGIWLAQIALLLPDLFQSATPALVLIPIEPLILADALVALFNQLAQPQRPLILVLDDLHWADAATLALLGHLALHVQRGSIFLLGTFCDALAEGRLAPLQQSLYRQNALAELAIPPLSTEELEQLVSLYLARYHISPELTGGCEALARWCYQHSEGNPFIALAWLSLAVKASVPEALHSATCVPEPVEILVKKQLIHLSQNSLSLLSAAAFLGSSFDLLAVVKFMNLDITTTIAACDELLQKALIAEDSPAGSGHYTFTHGVVRDVLLATMSSVQRHLLQQTVRSL